MSGSGFERESGTAKASGSLCEERQIAGGYQGVVYLVAGPDGVSIVKRPDGRGPMRALRRAMLRREHSIYQRLPGIAGIPACMGLGPDGELRLEFVRGASLRDAQPAPEQREQFFADLRDLILTMHRAGVAHGDLKRKDNILIASGGRPYLIDFGTAIAVSPQSGWLRCWVYRQMCRMDLNAWIKLKYRHQRADIDPADRVYDRPTLAERLARVVRQTWRLVTLRRWRNARR
ncbi:MAG: hypothetical protein QY320_04635 [Gammaproteobacteria bacterium]|nr:MAG: hypothetical protein QY320_04635 [Gammaproteobacteria bacterium]